MFRVECEFHLQSSQHAHAEQHVDLAAAAQNGLLAQLRENSTAKRSNGSDSGDRDGYAMQALIRQLMKPCCIRCNQRLQAAALTVEIGACRSMAIFLLWVAKFSNSA